MTHTNDHHGNGRPVVGVGPAPADTKRQAREFAEMYRRWRAQREDGGHDHHGDSQAAANQPPPIVADLIAEGRLTGWIRAVRR